MNKKNKKEVLQSFQNLADKLFDKYGDFPEIESIGYYIRYKDNKKSKEVKKNGL